MNKTKKEILAKHAIAFDKEGNVKISEKLLLAAMESYASQTKEVLDEDFVYVPVSCEKELPESGKHYFCKFNETENYEDEIIDILWFENGVWESYNDETNDYEKSDTPKYWLKKVPTNLLSKVSEGGMKWIKASERLPEKEGVYYGKGWGEKMYVLEYKEGLFRPHNGNPISLPFDNLNLKWLDETHISSVGSEGQSKKGIEDKTVK